MAVMASALMVDQLNELQIVMLNTTTLKMNHTRAKQKSGNEMHPSPDAFFFERGFIYCFVLMQTEKTRGWIHFCPLFS
jgi:hypothetical protein